MWLLLAIVCTVGYHLVLKVTPAGANPLLSLMITYALVTLLLAALHGVWLSLRRRQRQAAHREVADRLAHERHLLELNAGLEQRVQERTQSLADVEHFLRTVLDAVPSMISYWDRDQINRTANRANLAWRLPQGGTLVGRYFQA